MTIDEKIGQLVQYNANVMMDTDNRFNLPTGRFPEIEEDEALYRLLCNEYRIAR